jgi:3-oxoacyl-[acyl-carrier protein] reductase
MSKPVCIVTGASNGIGSQIAIAFAKAGYDVVINYASSVTAAQSISDTCRTFDVKTLLIQADVSQSAEVKEMIKQVMDTFGKVDVLVNNAGITKDQLLLRMSEEDFDKVMAVNLKGTFNCTQQVSKLMVKVRSGKIINIASVIGLVGNIGQTNYAASKGAIIAFTKACAKELASRGITVNAIAPGFISTKMTDQLNENLQAEFLKQIPLGRFGKAEEVADLALFLASDQANYITGQVIQVDGGMVM